MRRTLLRQLYRRKVSGRGRLSSVTISARRGYRKRKGSRLTAFTGVLWPLSDAFMLARVI